MRFRLFRRFVFVISALGLIWPAPSSAQSMEEATPVLAETLAKQLVEKKRGRVGALDFTDIQGRPNELGRVLADHLMIDMFGANGITVIDRANLNAVLAEHKLTAEGLVDPQNREILGQFKGVEAILVGNLTTIDAFVTLTVRAISTVTSEVVAAGRMRIAATDDVRRMLGLSVSTNARDTPSAVVSTVLGPGAAAVAPSSIGPLLATVKSINYGLVGEGTGLHPQISVTVEFENRNLNASVAIAANSQVVAAPSQTAPSRRVPTTGLIFGALQDSSGVSWYLRQGGVRGLPIVYGFETEALGYAASEPRRITQNSPSNVVEYMRRGVEYGGRGLSNESQSLWAGSFASIEPGGRLEATAVFVPSYVLETGANRAIRDRAQAGARSQTPPEAFDLSLELVLATYKEGERPEKARDLALRNLVISRLLLPQAAGGGRSQ